MRLANGYSGANHRSVKQSNRAAIFRAIHRMGPIARVDLARETGLNPATVSHIVEELIASGLASETGVRSPQRAGRRPISLEINPTAGFAVGLDLARHTITGALVDLSGVVHARVEEEADSPWREETAVPIGSRVVERLLRPLTSSQRDRVVGVGMGIPGPVSIRTGNYLAPRSFDSWRPVALAAELERRWHLPTFVDNNANTSALAALWFGAGQGAQNFVLLNLGVGVGTGLVLDGDVYRGNHDLAGEAGHLSVDLDGPRCACGNNGCLETYVSVPRVLQAVRSGSPRGRKGRAADVTLPEAVTALHAGDPHVVDVFADVARHLAAGIVTIIYTLDPELILLGRELSAAGDALVVPVREEVRRRIFPAMRDTVRIEVSNLVDAPTIGAATLALREIFQAPLGARVRP
ncbi:ROK family protein [Actinopolymorpha singaporensis]